MPFCQRDFVCSLCVWAGNVIPPHFDLRLCGVRSVHYKLPTVALVPAPPPFAAARTITSKGIQLKDGTTILIKPGDFRALKEKLFSYTFARGG